MRVRPWRIAWAAAAALVAAVLVGVLCLRAAAPELERRWSYNATRPDPTTPWQVPPGAEAVSIPAEGGNTLRGWFFEASTARNGLTVLVLHGSVGYLPAFVADAQRLRELGFNVLLFNYRGFGMSDGQMGDEEGLDADATAALDYLTRQRRIAPSSIALVGVSLGAPVAAHLAARFPCRAVALVSPVTSARFQARQARPWLPDLILDHLNSPFDTVDKIDDARCPVLMVHGARDKVVPLAQVRLLYEAARPPKKLVVVPQGTHHLSDFARDFSEFVLRGR